MVFPVSQTSSQPIYKHFPNTLESLQASFPDYSNFEKNERGIEDSYNKRGALLMVCINIMTTNKASLHLVSVIQILVFYQNQVHWSLIVKKAVKLWMYIPAHQNHCMIGPTTN